MKNSITNVGNINTINTTLDTKATTAYVNGELGKKAPTGNYITKGSTIRLRATNGEGSKISNQVGQTKYPKRMFPKGGDDNGYLGLYAGLLMTMTAPPSNQTKWEIHGA